MLRPFGKFKPGLVFPFPRPRVTHAQNPHRHISDFAHDGVSKYSDYRINVLGILIHDFNTLTFETESGLWNSN